MRIQSGQDPWVMTMAALACFLIFTSCGSSPPPPPEVAPFLGDWLLQKSFNPETLKFRWSGKDLTITKGNLVESYILDGEQHATGILNGVYVAKIANDPPQINIKTFNPQSGAAISEEEYLYQPDTTMTVRMEGPFVAPFQSEYIKTQTSN